MPNFSHEKLAFLMLFSESLPSPLCTKQYEQTSNHTNRPSSAVYKVYKTLREIQRETWNIATRSSV